MRWRMAIQLTLVPLVLLEGTNADLAAQRQGAISGQVSGSPSGVPLPDVGLELNGERRTRTDANGRFRFAQVTHGPVHLYVEMIGYEPIELEFTLAGDTILNIVLTEAAIRLDTIAVEARTISIRGRATDPRSRLGVSATVIAYPGPRRTETSITGRYRLSNVPVTDSTFVSIEAFGYAPQTQHVEATSNTVVNFVMTRDSLAALLINRQIQRLSARSDSLGVRVRRGTYDDFSHAGTIFDVIRYQYQVRGYRCLVFDDDPERRFWVAPLPQEVELVEIIGQRGTFAPLVRVYTKEYFARNMASERPLKPIRVPSRYSRAKCE